MTPENPLRTDVLVVGAGPAGAAAAAWLARAGRQVLLADAEDFPRDKACGDGLTPRAIAEMRRLGMADWLAGRPVNLGLRAHGFGQTLHLPWPGGSLPATGSAAPRTELDAAIRQRALDSGAEPLRARAVGARFEDGRLAAVEFEQDGGAFEVRADQVVVADGARSQLGRQLGRQWHKETVYGVAARGYIDSGRADDPWISSHLELRGEQGEILSGYGWIFPLGGGSVNIGVGTLATVQRPADINLRQLLNFYAGERREEWRLGEAIERPWSALLPMGGAVSGVAGPNWVLVGDAAGCVNPLNGEGIDYGLETGRLAAEFLSERPADATNLWPALLREHYGSAFSAARRFAGLLTQPELLRKAGPVGMRSRYLMEIALRVMGNFFTPADQDVVARLWRAAGTWSLRQDPRPPFS